MDRRRVELETGLAPYLSICTDFDGEPSTDEDEMTEATFLSLEEIKQIEGSLFAPFADSINQLQAVLKGEVY